jgi:hypothetical protein
MLTFLINMFAPIFTSLNLKIHNADCRLCSAEPCQKKLDLNRFMQFLEFTEQLLSQTFLPINLRFSDTYA